MRPLSTPPPAPSSPLQGQPSPRGTSRRARSSGGPARPSSPPVFWLARQCKRCRCCPCSQGPGAPCSWAGAGIAQRHQPPPRDGGGPRGPSARPRRAFRPAQGRPAGSARAPVGSATRRAPGGRPRRLHRCLPACLACPPHTPRGRPRRAERSRAAAAEPCVRRRQQQEAEVSAAPGASLAGLGWAGGRRRGGRGAKRLVRRLSPSRVRKRRKGGGGQAGLCRPVSPGWGEEG